MNYSLILRPDAEIDLAEIVDWYEASRPGLGGEFLIEFNSVLARLQTLPLSFPIGFRTARRALTVRFPYAVYFLVLFEQIEVIAVLLGKRDQPRVLRKRLRR